MQRYFFDSADGERDVDYDGVLLACDADAREEAARYLGALLAENPALATSAEGFRVYVRRGADDAPVAILRIQFAD